MSHTGSEWCPADVGIGSSVTVSRNHTKQTSYKYVIEGNIDEMKVTGRRRRRRRQLLDGLKENRGYWKLKEETLDRSLWRTRFERGYGPVVRQTTE